MIDPGSLSDLRKSSEINAQLNALGGPVPAHEQMYRYVLNFWSEKGVPPDEPLAVGPFCIDLSSYPGYADSSMEEKLRSALVLRSMWYATCPHREGD